MQVNRGRLAGVVTVIFRFMGNLFKYIGYRIIKKNQTHRAVNEREIIYYFYRNSRHGGEIFRREFLFFLDMYKLFVQILKFQYFINRKSSLGCRSLHMFRHTCCIGNDVQFFS